MSDASEDVRSKAWCLFEGFSDVVCAQLPKTDDILAARREGLTGPYSVRLFAQAFEAIIQSSRNDQFWQSLDDTLRTADRLIVFRRPLVTERSIGPSSESDLRAVFDSLARCVACAIVQSKTIPPKPQVLEREFSRCRTCWESATINYEVVAPISGMNTNRFDDPVVAAGLRLSGQWRISENARHQLERSPYQQPLSLPMTILLGERSIDKGETLEALATQAIKDVAQCVTSLRLATGHILGCDTVHLIPSPSDYQTFHGLPNCILPLGETSLHAEFFGDTLVLTDEALDTARRLATLLSTEVASSLEIAVERFNLAMGRRKLEDQIIDLAIALESTICRGGGEQLSYRFRVFGAAILAGAPGVDNPVSWLRSMYEARSKVVHEGQRLAKFKTRDLQDCQPLDFVAKCRELARLILLDFIEQAALGRTPTDYIRALEMAMIASAKRVDKAARD